MTDKFISYIVSLTQRDYSFDVLKMAKSVLVDYLGVRLAGARIIGDKCKSLSDSLGNAMLVRALTGGICAHVVELDDGHRIGMVHPGAPVISALLAVAEEYSVSQDDLLRGIIVGYETTIRLASAVQPSHKLKYYHATGTCGTVGAAMGIAAMLGFDFEQFKSAFAAATTSAAGILEMIDGDTQMKPYNAGRAAMDGVAAAFIGKARFKYPEDALGGNRGFLKVMTDNPQLEFVTDFSSDHYMIESIYRKPYAACRHCHPSIEAALHIRKKDGFDINNVERVDVYTYRLAVEGHDHTLINGNNSAKMSIPFSFAVALCSGKAGIDEFDGDRLCDPTILKIAEKVNVSSVDELTSLCPQKRVAIVEVKASNGIYRERIDYPKGEPENPLTKQEMEEKFRGLAQFGGLTPTECDTIIDEIQKESFRLSTILSFVGKRE